jgi:hypothetical protein
LTNHGSVSWFLLYEPLRIVIKEKRKKRNHGRKENGLVMPIVGGAWIIVNSAASPTHVSEAAAHDRLWYAILQIFKGPRVHCSWLTSWYGMIQEQGASFYMINIFVIPVERHSFCIEGKKTSVGTCVKGQLVHFFPVTRISIAIQCGLPRQDRGKSSQDLLFRALRRGRGWSKLVVNAIKSYK